MQKLSKATMKSAGKNLLAILTIALVTQTTIDFHKTAKADEEADLQNAKRKLDDGNYSEALKIYDVLLQKGIKTADVYYGRGRSLQELGNNEKSLASYTKLILSLIHI